MSGTRSARCFRDIDNPDIRWRKGTFLGFGSESWFGFGPTDPTDPPGPAKPPGPTEPPPSAVPDPVDDGMPLERLEAQICSLAGHLAASTHDWLVLIAEFDRRKGWAQWG
jgi:hypothetical protein